MTEQPGREPFRPVLSDAPESESAPPSAMTAWTLVVIASVMTLYDILSGSLLHLDGLGEASMWLGIPFTVVAIILLVIAGRFHIPAVTVTAVLVGVLLLVSFPLTIAIVLVANG